MYGFARRSVAIYTAPLRFGGNRSKRLIYQNPQVGRGYIVYFPYKVKSVHCLALRINWDHRFNMTLIAQKMDQTNPWASEQSPGKTTINASYATHGNYLYLQNTHIISYELLKNLLFSNYKLRIPHSKFWPRVKCCWIYYSYSPRSRIFGMYKIVKKLSHQNS